MHLAAFGGSYKKKADFKTEGKTQEPMYAGAGKEECTLLGSAIQLMFKSNSFVDAGADRPKLVNAVLGACWAFGQSSDYHGCSMLPNGLASLRLLASGEVSWILFSLMDLVPYLRTWWGKDDISTTALLDFVAKSTEKDWMEIGAPLGVAGYWVTHKAGEVLYIPTGYCAAERTSQGVLIYGIRRAMMPQTPASVSNYEMYLHCSSTDGSLAGLHEPSRSIAVILPVFGHLELVAVLLATGTA